MALIICYVIACVQILGVGYNFWSFDPRILLNLPGGRDLIFLGLFLVVQLLGLAGAIMILARMRLGLIVSILHHVLILPALLFTSSRFMLMTDDLINATLFYISTPSGSDFAFYWSLGWGTVFDQVTKSIPRGATFIGVNLFALACAVALWLVMRQLDAAAARREAEMAMRRRQQARRRAPERPQQPPQPQPQQQRPRPQHQGVRQPPRMPPREY